MHEASIARYYGGRVLLQRLVRRQDREAHCSCCQPCSALPGGILLLLLLQAKLRHKSDHARPCHTHQLPHWLAWGSAEARACRCSSGLSKVDQLLLRAVLPLAESQAAAGCLFFLQLLASPHKGLTERLAFFASQRRARMALVVSSTAQATLSRTNRPGVFSHAGRRMGERRWKPCSAASSDCEPCSCTCTSQEAHSQVAGAPTSVSLMLSWCTGDSASILGLAPPLDSCSTGATGSDLPQLSSLAERAAPAATWRRSSEGS